MEKYKLKEKTLALTALVFMGVTSYASINTNFKVWIEKNETYTCTKYKESKSCTTKIRQVADGTEKYNCRTVNDTSTKQKCKTVDDYEDKESCTTGPSRTEEYGYKT